MTYCHECGSENPPGASFCHICGTKLFIDATSEAQDNVVEYNAGRSDGADHGPASPIAQDQATSAPIVQASNTTSSGQNAGIDRGRKGHKMIAIIVASLLVAVLIVAAALVVGSYAAPTAATPSIVLINGDYLLYNVTVSSSGSTTYESEKMIFSNITSSRMNIEYIINSSGNITSRLYTFELIGNEWIVNSTNDSQPSGPVTMTDQGQQSISTVYGQKTVEEYEYNTTSYTEHDWDDQVTGLQYECFVQYHDAGNTTKTYLLVSTNIGQMI